MSSIALFLSKRRLWLTLGAVVALAAGLVPWGLSWLLVREIDFLFEAADAGERWSLEWTPGRGDPRRTGYWIDLAEEAAPDGAGRFHTPEAAWIYRRLPVYEFGDLRLRWHDSAGATFRISKVVVTTRILGAVRHRERPGDLSVEGAAPEADGWLRCMSEEGAVSLPAPARPWTDAAVVWGVLAGAIAGCGAAAWGAWRLAGFLHGLLERRPRVRDPIPRRHPVLAGAAILATVGVPVWMLLWAPMLIGGDSIEYIQFADAFLRAPGVEHYDGWRLPGYALLLLPAVWAMDDYTVGVGVLHAVLAMLAPVLAWAALRRRVSARWAWIGMLAVALDPMLIVWQRHVLAECTAVFLVMLLLWLLVRLEDWCRERRPEFGAMVVAFVLLGVLLGYCTLVRGNFQLALVLVPAFAAWSAARCVSRTRAVVLAGACLAAGTAVLAPWYLHVHRTFGTWGLTAGDGRHLALRAWLSEVADWNQTGVHTFEEVRDIRRQIEDGTIQEFIYTDLVGAGTVYPVPEEVPFRRARDIRCDVAFRESRARLPDKFLPLVPKAFVSLLGFPVPKPDYYRGFSFQLVRDLIGSPSGYETNLHFTYDIVPPEFKERLLRGVKPMDLDGSANAAVLGAAWNVAWAARPAISILFLIAAAGFLRRRDIPMLAMSAIVLAHMTALPVLYYAGGDRYIMPWWGLAGVLVIAGLARRNS